MKAVFTTKAESRYDDLPEFRYHFPRIYLRQAEAAVGDWIVYYEPRRTGVAGRQQAGRLVYFATARVTTIEPDPTNSDHFYAFVSDYLEFDRPVHFKEGNFYYEDILEKEDGSTNVGAFGRAIRSVSDREYDLILRSGFADIISTREEPASLTIGFAEDQEAFERPIIERLVARPFRDAAFAQAVKIAYGNSCAITGLKIINGGGHAEVQAAHIRPVASSGPDSVRNGLALCGTMHWMFDRGLLSLDDDFSILKAGDRVPDTVDRIINIDGKLRLPSRPEFRPHANFLRFHRENVFMG